MTKCMEPVIDRAAWLERRRQTLGASDAAAALGLSPYCSPLQLYLRKIGSLPEQEETEAMRWGTLLEPLLAREYTRRTGLPLPECDPRRYHCRRTSARNQDDRGLELEVTR
jgi:predicted phage-related endonuclease